MYDYIELYGKEDYSTFITKDEFCELFVNQPNCERQSVVSFIWTIGDFGIRIQGIECDRNGNYGFNNDSKFKRINLIDINLPQGSESIYHEQIQAFVLDLASVIGWKINWRED